MKRTAVLAAVTAVLCSCGTSQDRNQVMEKAVEAFEEQRYEDARTLFDRALQMGRGSVGEMEFDILRYRAECEVRTGDLEAAEKTYEVLQKTSGEGEELAGIVNEHLEMLTALKKAEELSLAGKYKEAAGIFAQYAGTDTAAARSALKGQAYCMEYLLEWEKAYELLKTYLTVCPEDEEARKEAVFAETRCR